MNRDYYQSPQSSSLMRLFWKAAGADRFILERSTYGDQIKYLCLGGIIIATGVMAGLAGGYAFYTIFEPRGQAIDSFRAVQGIPSNYDPTDIPTMLLAITFGIIWGLIIFNIDRFIVTSTGKGDGTEEITRKELKTALPRLIMGTIIALTISKPVEIRMFKTEIDVKLHEKQMEQQHRYKAGIDSTFNSELRKKDLEIAKVENLLAEKRARYSNLQTQYIEEVRIITKGPRAFAIEEQMKNLEREIKELEARPDYIKVKKEKELIELERQDKLKESEKYASGLNGLLERIKIAHEISGFWISFFITFLFLAIELTPIFFKLMLIKSPYDYIEENIKELIKAEHGIQIDHNYYQDKEGIERDKITHHEVLRLLKERVKLLESQTEISEEAIDAWKKKKLAEAKENPTEFIVEENIYNNGSQV